MYNFLRHASLKQVGWYKINQNKNCYAMKTLEVLRRNITFLSHNLLFSHEVKNEAFLTMTMMIMMMAMISHKFSIMCYHENCN